MSHNRVVVVGMTLAAGLGVACIILVLMVFGTRPSVVVAHSRTVTMGQTAYDVAFDPQTNHVFVVTTDTAAHHATPSYVSTLDVRTWRVVRTVPVGMNAGTIVVDSSAHQAFVLNAGMPPQIPGSISVLVTGSGRLLRSISLKGQLAELALDASAHHLFVTDESSNMVDMLDAKTGTLLHRVIVGQTPVSLAVDEQTARVFVANQGSNTISVLDAHSGAVLRSVSVGNSPARIVVDKQSGHVFIGNYNGSSVSMLDAQSGQVLRTCYVHGYPNAMVADPRTGHVFVVVQSANTIGPGSIAMLSATSGQLVSTVPLGVFPVGIALDAPRGRVVVTLGGIMGANGTPIDAGQIIVLDARTGHVRRGLTIRGSLGPYNIAIDESTGHVFVANTGGSLPRIDTWGWLPTQLRRSLLIPLPYPRRVPASISMLDLSR